METLFLFQFCLRDLFVKNEDTTCYARPTHRKGALALGQCQLARSFHIHDREGRKWLSGSEFENTRQISNYKDAEEQEFSHSMQKDRAS